MITNKKLTAMAMTIVMIMSTLTMFSPNAAALPTTSIIVWDAADGIGTVYQDGGGNMVGLNANNTGWIIGRLLTQHFNVAQCPEETNDFGMDYSVLGGGDWFEYDATGQWGQGSGVSPGNVAIFLTRLESGESYTHMGVPVITTTNYSVAERVILNTDTPQYTAGSTLEPIPVPAHDGVSLTWSDWTTVENQGNCVGWRVYYSDTGIARGNYILQTTVGPGPGSVVGSGHKYWVIEPLWDNTGGTPTSYANYLFSNYATEPPRVISTIPIDGLAGVGINSNYTLKFSRPMNKTLGNISLVPAPLIAGSWSWSANGIWYNYTGTTWAEQTKYYVNLTNFKDTLGKALSGDMKFNFTTGDFTAPILTSTTPINGAKSVAINQNIVLTFSEAMNTTSLAYTCVPNPFGWSVAWSAGNTTATLTHTNFTESTPYTFTVLTASDKADNGFTTSMPNPFTFTTGDFTAPTITLTNPTNTATGIALTANIVVTFSEAMNVTSVTHSCTPDPSGWSVVWSGGNTTATFSHSTAFAENAIYTFQINDGKDIAGNALVAGAIPNPWTFTAVGVPPTITVTSPVNTSVGVLLMDDVVVTFSEAMNNATVTFTCVPNPTGWSVAWSGGNTMATYSHSAAFIEKTLYTFTITAGTDVAGNSLVIGAVPNPWNFTTGDFTDPIISSTVPADTDTGVALAAPVVLTFNEAMNTASITYICSPDPTGWSVVWSGGNTIATYSHSAAFTENTVYTFQITACSDVAGNLLAAGAVPNPWTFTTIGIAPTIAVTTPTNIATGIALTATVVVTFSEAMNNASVTYTCVPAVTVWSVVWSAGNTIATYSHTNPFIENTAYTFTITAGNDVNGVALGIGSTPNPWSFTTLGIAPTITNTVPANTAIGIALASTVVVTFSEAMNNASVTYTCVPAVTVWSVVWSAGNTIATYSHTNPFIENTAYTFTITAGNDVNGVALGIGSTPNPWSFTTLGIAPTITNTVPANTATGIALASTVVVTFSEAMNNASVTYTCVPAVTVWSVVWSAGNTIATYSHTNPFVENTLYTFTITAGNDVNGVPLVAGAVPNPWTFSTLGIAPTITITSPVNAATGVALAANVVVTFSEAMNTGSVTYTCVPAVTIWSVVWSAGNTIATYSHTNLFVENTLYTFNITAGTDIAGNALVAGAVPNPWTFTTLGIAPTITNTVPANAATAVALTADVVVTFSEAINNASVTYTCVPAVTVWSVVWSGGNTIATYSHTNPFIENTAYTFTITAGNDVNGVALGIGSTPNPWSFTTLGIAPTITNTVPASAATGIALASTVVVTFSEAMINASVTYTCVPAVTVWSVVWSAGNTIATYSHTNPFIENTAYTFTITAGNDANGVALVAGAVPNPWTFTTLGIAPTITNTVPANTATGVALASTVVVTFSEAMNNVSVTYTCVPAVTVWSVVWSAGNTIATYSHTNPFIESTAYTFTITAGNDANGVALVAGAVPNPWTFTTVGIPPTLTGTNPVNGVTGISLTANMVVTFSEAMNTGSVTYTCVPAATVWSVTWSAGNTIATYSHTNPFIENTLYTFNITAGTDIAGNALVAGAVPNPWAFTTVGDAPTIVSTVPTSGTFGVGHTTEIVVTFSEAMVTSSVTFTCTPNPGIWSVVWSVGDTIATFNHSTAFTENTLYAFAITGGTDIPGNSLVAGAVSNPWTFTTLGIAPIITNTVPASAATGVALASTVVVTFSEAMNNASVTYTCVPAVTVWSVVWSAGNTIATYSHTNPFIENTAYTFTITAGNDANGVALGIGSTPNPWSFTTLGIAPTITNTVPASAAIGIALASTVVVTFSEAMNTATVTYTCVPAVTVWSVVWSAGNTIATYSHTNPFIENTAYTFTLTAGNDANGVALVAGTVPNPWTFTTLGIAPTISNTVPANTATGVALASTVVVTFSEAMNNVSVTYTCVPAVTVWSVVWSAGNTIATYSHTNPFIESTAYTFTITAGNDANGVALVAGAVPNPWTFTTLGIAPTITNTVPASAATGIALASTVVVTFSEAMNNASVTYTCVPAVTVWSVVWSAGNTIATYSHTNLFVENTLYTFTITAGNDANGVALVAGAVPNPWTFTTAGVGPTISVANPVNGATGVLLTSTVVVTFSEAMNTGTVTYTCVPAVTVWSVVWSGGNTIATYSHTNPYVENTTYTFTITAGNDANGVALVSGAIPNPWTFTALATPPTITTIVPADGATGVVLGSTVVVTWSEAMNPTVGTVTISPVPLVAGTWAWSAGNTIYTYSGATWRENLAYTLTFTLFTDVNAVSAGGDLVKAFTTLGVAPNITVTSPTNLATGVVLTSTVVVTFSEAMNTGTVTYTCVPAVTVWSVVWSAGNTIATYSHTNPFVENTLYTFTITAGNDVNGVALLSGAVPNPWTFTTLGTAPTIISTVPADSATGIAITATVVVTFSEAMNTATVTYSCVPAVTIWSVVWSAGNTIATYSHTNQFVENTSYTFTITAGNDANGVALVIGSTPNPWVFTTLGNAPIIISTVPADSATDVALTSTIVVTFSEAMNTGTVTYTCVPAVTVWSVVWSGGNTIATYSHTNPFVENTSYTFTITAGNDVNGVALGISSIPPNPWTFTTLGVAPVIMVTVPVSAATGVALTATVGVTFSEAMNNASVNFTCVPAVAGWSVVWSAGNTIATFSHAVDFTENTIFTFTITAGNDVAGNPLAMGSAQNPWSFTTLGFAPSIATIIPNDGAAGVPLASTVVVTWSEAMNSTVGTVSINPVPLIAGTWTWSADNITCTYSGATWRENQLYTLTFTLFTDANGVAATGDLVKAFTTLGVAPTIIITSPVNTANGVALTSTIVVTFSEAMDTGSVPLPTCVPPIVGGFTVVWSGGNTIATYSHITRFAEYTPYTITIIAGNDANGVALGIGSTPNPWSFTTNSTTISYIQIEFLNGTELGDMSDLTTDDTITLYARGYGASGNFIGTVSVNWAMTGGIGIFNPPIGSSTTVNFTKPGIGMVIAYTAGGLLVDITGDLTVTAGSMRYYIIPGTGATTTADNAFRFTIVANDSDGNAGTVPAVTWTAENGTINSAGLFTPWSVGTWNISANLSGMWRNTTIRVIAGRLASISVNPQYMITGENQPVTFTMAGYDSKHNINTTTGSTYWYLDGQFMGQTGTVYSGTPGNHTVFASHRGFVGNATLNVREGTIVVTQGIIAIHQTAITITADQICTFSVTVTDVNGNILPVPTVIAWEAVNGTIVNGIFTPWSAGTWTIYANATGHNGGTATIVVTAGSVTSISISSSSGGNGTRATGITAGQSVLFTANAVDLKGNLVSVPSANLDWSASAAVGTVSNGLLTAVTYLNGAQSVNGILSVTYHSGATTISGTENITVNVGPLHHITVSEAAAVGLHEYHEFTAQGFDVYGNVITGLAFIWGTVGNVGVIDSAGVFQGTTQGIGAVTATTGGVVGERSVFVTTPAGIFASWLWLVIVLFIIVILLVIFLILGRRKEVVVVRETESEDDADRDEESEDEEYSEPEEISEDDLPEEEVSMDIPEDEETDMDVPDALTEEEIPEEFTEPLADLEEELESLNIEHEQELEMEETPSEEEGPQVTSMALKQELAEQLRIDRCEKMLTAAVVLPDDKEKLKTLIAGGISAQDFTDEVKKAIEKRKKKEKEKDVTADEKASILEDELVAELAELEDELDDDMKEEDLEDQILKEIEDLEDL